MDFTFQCLYFSGDIQLVPTCLSFIFSLSLIVNPMPLLSWRRYKSTRIGSHTNHSDRCWQGIYHSLELHPQQMSGPHGGLVGLVGGRWKIRWKNCLSWAWTLGPQALSQGHNRYTTQPHVNKKLRLCCTLKNFTGFFLVQSVPVPISDWGWIRIQKVESWSSSAVCREKEVL